MKPFIHLFVVAAFAMTTSVSLATTNFWRGGPFANAWSDRNNWDPGVPQNGDTLVFRTGNGAMVNDLTNLIVQTLLFDGGITVYDLQGNNLAVSGGIFLTIDQATDVRIRCGLVLTEFVSFGVSYYSEGDLEISGPVDLNGRTLRLLPEEGSSINISGPISGSGSVLLSPESTFGFGTVKFSGAEPNTFTGSVDLTSVRASGWVGLPGGLLGARLELDKQSGPAVPGWLFIGINCTVELKRAHQIADSSPVLLSGGARLKLEGNTDSIASLYLVGEANGPWTAANNQTLVDTGGATLSVAGDVTAEYRFTNNMPTIKGVLGLPPGSHTIHTLGSNPYGLRIEAAIVGEGGFTKRGTNGLILEGDSTFTGDAVIEAGQVEVKHNNGLGSPVGATILFGGELTLNGVAVVNESLFVDRDTARLQPSELGALLNCVNVCSWSGPVEINTTHLTVNGGNVTFTGPISGSGGVRFLFNDRVHLGGTQPNTYAGDTFTDATLLELNKPSGVAAFGGRLIVGSGRGRPTEVRWLQNYQRVGAEVILYSAAGTEAVINLNNHREDFGPVRFNGGFIDTGAAGELGLYGLVDVTSWDGDAVINGRIGLPPGFHEFHVDDAPRLADLLVNATVIGPGHIRKTGFGQMWLNASNSYSGLTTVAEGSIVAYNADALGNPSTGTTVNEGASLILNAPNSTVRETLAISGAGDGAHGALNVFGDVTLRTAFPSIYAAIDFTTNVTIRVEAGSRLVVDGFISGTGPFTKTGPGWIVLANANPNTYSGDTFVVEGVLNLSKPNQAVSVPGDLFVGPAPLNSTAIARWSTEGGMSPSAVVVVNARSLLDLNGNNQSLARLNLNDGGGAQTGAGTLSFIPGSTVNVGSLDSLGSHQGSFVTGNIGLAPNASLTFNVSPFAPTPPFYLGPELDVNAAIPAPADNLLRDGAGLTKSGAGRMRLFGNNSFRGWVNIGEGALTAGNSTALGAVFFRSGTYVFNSGTLQLEGGVNIEGENLVLNSTATPALESLFGESYWSGQVTLSRDSSIGANPGSVLQLAGVIAGTGNLTKLGAGTLRFGGGNANTYSGETSVNEGTLLMSKPHGTTAVPGSLSIGTPAGLPAVAANLTSYQVIGNIFVNRGGLLNLYDQVENVDHLWLTEGGDVQTTTGILFLKSGGSIQVVPGAVADSSTIAGNLDMDVGTHIINVGSGTSAAGAPDLEITALMTSSLGPVTPRKYGPGTLRLAANNTYSGTTVVDEGILRMDGVQPQSNVQVNPAGTLQGIGVLDSIGFGGNGVVAPGASPGILTCNNLLNTSGSGILEIELNGPAPGANGYDQLNVKGIVTLSGITLRVRANFIANTNQQFVLIDNQSANAVQGTFNGLPQNATVTAADQIFRITYTGGDGNDVVLTKIANVFRPTLRIEHVPPLSVRLLWPTNDPAFVLQFTTNMSGTTWAAASPSPLVAGTNNVVTNGTVDVRKFYRLFKP